MTKIRGKDILPTLNELYACSKAKDWVEENRNLTIAQLWSTCPQGDWMLWMAHELNISKKQIVMAACQCARLSLKFIPAEEKRPIKNIEIAEKWCRGEATIKQVRAATYAAATYGYAATYTAVAAARAAHDAAAYAADAYAAAAAADAAAYAADAAYDAAYAAYAAARRAHDAAAYAADAYACAAKKAMQKKTARAVRKHIAWRDIEKGFSKLKIRFYNC